MIEEDFLLQFQKYNELQKKARNKKAHPQQYCMLGGKKNVIIVLCLETKGFIHGTLVIVICTPISHHTCPNNFLNCVID